jgi:hypothetical protein
MAEIVLTSPVLSYVGAVDISSENQGKTLYNISFHGTLNTLANVLMFEYKLQDIGTNANNVNVEFGYVEHSNFHSGIVNQWQISIPSKNSEYNPSVEKTVQVRVYAGVVDSSSVVVTEWSNALAVHNPPKKPIFFDDTQPTAMYDIGYGENPDDLYVFLKPDSEIDYDVVKFLVAYYYTDKDSGNTMWDVSDQISAEDITIGVVYQAKMLRVPDFGKVSVTLQVVYVSVYAVYEFSDASEHSFYSVSEVTTIKEAQDASYFEAPILSETAITYHMYDEEPAQEMSISWSAPLNTYLPIYNISRYVLEVSTDNGENWTGIDDNITNTYYNNYSTNYPCGTTLSFRVKAIDENDNTSSYSAVRTMNIFEYALAPQNLTVTQTSAGEGISMRVQFDETSDRGCGDGNRYIVKVNGSIVEEPEFNINNTSYDFMLSGLDVSNSGIVEVYLLTNNTNTTQGPSTLAGASITAPYIAYTLTLDNILYEVYDDRSSQLMNLSWNSITDGDWSVTNYTVEKSTNGETFETETTTSSPSYNYNAASNDDNDSLIFKIVANMSITYNSEVYTYSITSNTQAINVFKYASAPRNLEVINTVTNGTNLTSITISFEEPQFIRSGEAFQYVIDVDGDLHYINYGDSTTNDGDSTTNVTLSIDGEVGLTGNVTVHLETENTNYNVPDNNNQGSQYLEGDEAVIPFASSNLSLYDIDYRIYSVDKLQIMALSWSTVSLDNWTVDNYAVMVNTGTGFAEHDTTNSTTFNYTSNQDCDTILQFKIIAHLINGDTTYEIESNIQSMEIFKYAEIPATGRVNWSVANINIDTGVSNNINVNIDFTNSSVLGCGEPDRYVVELLDSNRTLITSTDMIEEPIQYNASSTLYEVNFDVNSYIASGYVNIYLVTTDTNSSDMLAGAVREVSFTTSQLPYYINQTVVSSSLFTFNVITQTLITPTATLAYQYDGEAKDFVTWSTAIGDRLTNNGVSVVRTTEDNGEYKYTIQITPRIINNVKTVLPQWFAISTSNQAGVGTDVTVRD